MEKEKELPVVELPNEENQEPPGFLEKHTYFAALVMEEDKVAEKYLLVVVVYSSADRYPKYTAHPFNVEIHRAGTDIDYRSPALLCLRGTGAHDDDTVKKIAQEYRHNLRTGKFQVIKDGEKLEIRWKATGK